MHWTYATHSTEYLQQGDILSPSDELRAVLKEVHPHFLDMKYRAFLVLTQTCDLIRRDRISCKSRYINLAVVRSLEDILPSLLEQMCGSVTVGDVLVPCLFYEDTKGKAVQLLERILNQNEQAMGLFYLHPDADVEIAEPCVAQLQVSVALRAKEHYDTLLKARRGGLVSEFQGKLGWLIGNLFSRIGTKDWEPKDLRLLLEDFLAKGSSPSKPRWVRRASVQKAKEGNVGIAKLNIDQTVALLKTLEPQPPLDVAVERVASTIRELDGNVSDETVKRLTSRLKNDDTFKAALAKA
jgi:hypothetical protein